MHILKRSSYGWVIWGYVALLALLSWLIIRFDLPDSLLIAFIVPCVLAAFFYGRWVYWTMIGLGIAAAVWVTALVSPSFVTSLITIGVGAFSVSAMAEMVRALAHARTRRQEILTRQSEESRYMAEMGMALLDCDRVALVFEQLGVFLSRVTSDAIVIINQATPDQQSLITRQVIGLGGSLWSQAEDLVGFKVIGKVSPIVQEFRDYFFQARLQKIPGGFSALAASEIPQTVGKAVERLFCFHDVLTIGIADRDTIWGNVHIITRRATGPGSADSLPTHLIEAVVYQCFSTLSRINALEGLATSEQKYRLLFKNMTAGFALHETMLDENQQPYDYRLLEVNSAFEQLTGLQADELVGRTLLDVLPGLDLCWLEAYGRVVMTGEPARFEKYNQAWDGYYQVSVYVPAPGYLAAIFLDITERRRAEDVLRENSKELDRFFSSAIDLLCIADTDGHFRRLNIEWEKTLGYAIDELEGRRFLDFVHPDDLATTLEAVTALGEGHEIVNFTNRYRRKDGTYRWIEWRSFPTGKLIYAAARDITERRRVDKALRESEANFRTFFETMTDMIVVSTLDGHVLFTNSAVSTTLGYSAVELSGMRIPDLHPADLHAEAEALLAAIFRGECDTCPLPLARKDGGLVPVETRLWMGRWNGIDSIFGIFKNLTAEQEAQQRFERLFRNNPAPMALSTLPNQRFADVNNAFLETTGYLRDEVIGQTPAKLRLFAQPAQSEAVIQRLLVQGRVANVEMQVYCKDGTIREGVFGGEIISSHGQDYFLMVMLDVTARKQAEDELRRTTRLLDSVRKAQSLYIAQGDPQPVFDALLETLVSITDSEFGFLDEVLHDGDGTPYKLSLALSNISWNGDSEGLYAQLRARNLEFRNLKNLSGLPVILQEPVIANDAPHDPRSGGLPSGHPTIHAFMGLPVRVGGEVVGVIGVANRRGGYDETMAHFLEPYLNACAGIIQALRLRSREREVVKALRESEEKYRLLFDNAGDAIFIHDESARILAANKLASDWLGYTRAELISMTIYQVDAVREHPRVSERIARVIEKGYFAFETIFRRKDGSYIPMEVSARRIVWDGTPAMMSIVRDVTERKQAEEALSRYREHLEELVQERTAELQAQFAQLDAILRSVGDAIFMTDPQQRILYVNPAFTHLTGYSADEVLAKDARAGQVLVELAPRLSSIIATLMQEKLWQGEVRVQRKDGRYYDAALTIAPVYDDAAKVTGYVFTHHDISQAKDLERARRQFITNISHQLRTPLTPLKSGIYLLQRANLSGKYQQQLQLMQAGIDWLVHLIMDVEDILALDSGKGIEDWDVVSLPDIITAVVDCYQGQAQAAGLTLTSAPVPSIVPLVQGDAAQLTRALNELVENAVVFTPAGGQVNIAVQAGGVGEKGWVTVAVQDTGPGFLPEELPRVFDRFFRGRLAESGHTAGVGLGLSIAQKIAEVHGGRITVESVMGEGSTFTLWLRSASHEGGIL